MSNLPNWPQRANEMRRLAGIRNRLKKDLSLLNRLALQQSVKTYGRSALQVLSELEQKTSARPIDSPTYKEYRK